MPKLAALASADGGTTTMQFRADSTTSSRDWNPRSEDWRTTVNITMPTTSLPSLLGAAEGAGLPTIDLLKIDCEGCEYDVIPALNGVQLGAISRVVAELHHDGMLKNGQVKSKRPAISKVQVTHDTLCRRYDVCIDPITGHDYKKSRPLQHLLETIEKLDEARRAGDQTAVDRILSNGT
eukprot:SAG31_NODE_4766_length_2970_cov_2.727969_2_plen_179_part_00